MIRHMSDTVMNVCFRSQSRVVLACYFVFCMVTATTLLSTLSLHDALPIWPATALTHGRPQSFGEPGEAGPASARRSEEHTSELQSLTNLVCRLRLERRKCRRTCPLW